LKITKSAFRRFLFLERAKRREPCSLLHLRPPWADSVRDKSLIKLSFCESADEEEGATLFDSFAFIAIQARIKRFQTFSIILPNLIHKSKKLDLNH